MVRRFDLGPSDEPPFPQEIPGHFRGYNVWKLVVSPLRNSGTGEETIALSVYFSGETDSEPDVVLFLDSELAQGFHLSLGEILEKCGPI